MEDQVQTPVDVENVNIETLTTVSPKGDTHYAEMASSGQSKTDKTEAEVAPSGISIRGRNQVVPVSTSAIGFETMQQPLPEERKKHHITIATIWTSVSKGEVDRHSLVNHPLIILLGST